MKINASDTEITFKWKPSDETYDGIKKYYEYHILYSLLDVDSEAVVFAILEHKNVQSSQETTVTGLLPNVRYAIWVIPYRKIVGTDFHQDIVEAGTPSHKLVVRTLHGNICCS